MNPGEEIRFDGWTLHTATGELVKGSVRVRLQVQPQQVLEALLARPGELVTREQLIARLWPRGVVDFELSLNSAVRRLRAALGDHAETPSYIETIPRRGYRFIGTVDGPHVAASVTREQPTPGVVLRHRWRPAAAALLLLMASVTTGTLPRINSGEPEAGPPIVQTDAQAQEHYVRAQHFLHRRLPGDFERAQRNLMDALAIDPGFARAWAGLASAYWLDTVEGELSPEQGLPKLRQAAERALALDPRLAEAHLRLANYWRQSGDPHKAQELLETAIALDPHNPLGLSMSAGIAASNGQLDRAIELQRRAVEAEPLSFVNRGNLISWLIVADRLQEAQAELLIARELHPEAPGLESLAATTLILEGRLDEALVRMEALPDDVERRVLEAIAHHGLGNHAVADAALLALIETADGEAPSLRVAEVYAYRGEPDKAFAWLQASRWESCADPSLQHSPFLRPLRADPRWDEWVASARRQAAMPKRVEVTG